MIYMFMKTLTPKADDFSTGELWSNRRIYFSLDEATANEYQKYRKESADNYNASDRHLATAEISDVSKCPGETEDDVENLARKLTIKAEAAGYEVADSN